MDDGLHAGREAELLEELFDLLCARHILFVKGYAAEDALVVLMIVWCRLAVVGGGAMAAATAAACGAAQLVFAFTIPYVTIGLLGSLEIGGAFLLLRAVWARSTNLLILGVFQFVPAFCIVYFDYVNLAEALDKDAIELATEDDLERTVQKNVEDRSAAYAAIGLDVLVVLLYFVLAEALLDLRRAYLGEETDTEEPWVLQLCAALFGRPGGGGAAALQAPPSNLRATMV